MISKISGYVQVLDGEKVGKISVEIGAGRLKKEDEIDSSVGIIINKKISDKVEIGETLAYIHANDEQKGRKAVEDLIEAYKISEEVVEKPKCILDIIE